MRNLLSAHFARLWKSRLFWMCAVISLAYGSFSLYSWYQHSQILFDMGLSPELELMLELSHNFPLYIGILLAVFISLFLSAEYSGATIRNKLVIGHSRASVYLSSLISMAAVAYLCCAAYLLPMLIGGALHLHIDASDLFTLSGILALCAAYCAIFTGVSMNLDQKSAAPVSCLLGTFVLIYASQGMRSQLHADGPMHSVYRLFSDVLPFGQALRYTDVTTLTVAQILPMSLYSCAVTVLVTIVGLLLFRCKNIK